MSLLTYYLQLTETRQDPDTRTALTLTFRLETSRRFRNSFSPSEPINPYRKVSSDKADDS